MSNPLAAPRRFIGNALALMLIALALAAAVDTVATWLGSPSWVYCEVRSILEIGYGFPLALVLAVGGIVLWAGSAFSSRGGLVLLAGGVVIALAPQLLDRLLSRSCGSVEPDTVAITETAPLPIPRPRPPL